MRKITYRISEKFLIMLITPKRAGGVGLKPNEVIPYLNKTLGLRGEIVRIEVF